jgi:Ca-activated chloride channel family protein
MDEVPVSGGELRLAEPKVILFEGQRREAIGFPLQHTSIRAHVGGMMALYEVEQVFANPYDEAIEAVYVFPLGANGAINGYEIVIGDRTVTGEIKRREDARRMYQQAKVSGHTAGLVEQNKPNMFTQHVANIAPHEQITVRMRYVELLDYNDGAYTMAVPLTVGPRHKPSVGVKYMAPSIDASTVSFTADIDAGVPIVAIESPSHDIASTPVSATRSQVQLGRKAEIPNRDIVIRYKTAGPQTTVGLLTHRVDRDGYFMLAVQPKAEYGTGDIIPREVVLVLDRSGSMDGPPLAQAKAVASAIINTLGARDSFNIVAFASGVDAMSARPIAGDDGGKQRGLQYLSVLQSGGGTEMEAGVVSMLQTPPGQDRIRVVYFLTDGFVGNDDSVVGAAEKLLGTNRIFTVGIGSAPNRSLLDRLALAGRGYASYLTLTEPADKLAKDLVKKSAYPYLTDITIDWGGLDVEGVTPAHVPDIYAGQPLVLTGRYGKPGVATVRVAATAAGRRVVIPVAVALPTVNNFVPVASLWARREIDNRTAKGDVSGITELGLAYHLVTAHTSFIAIDRTRVVSNGQVRTIEQPSIVPEGVNGASAGADIDSSPGRSHRSSSRDDSIFSGGGGGWGGGGREDVETWMLIFLTLGVLWLIVRRASA